MRLSTMVRFRPFVWFVIFMFTFSSTPHCGALLSEALRLLIPEVQAAEASVNQSRPATARPQASDPAAKEQPKPEPKPEPKPQPIPKPTPSPATMTSADGGSGGAAGMSAIVPQTSMFSGAAMVSIPIEVPPGRNKMAPNLTLTYNNYQSNGWIGVGWTLDMGSIQRSTKYGVNYNATGDGAFTATTNGSSAELVSRSDWGSGYYGSKIEGSNGEYYLNPSTGGWEVTTKDGTKYYYGSTSGSRQAFTVGSTVYTFKWCLNKVQDTNGNYMTVSYWKDTTNGEIYLDRIDYTGNANAGLGTSNYVTFSLEDRTDAAWMYTSNYPVKTMKRLQRIETYAGGSLVKRYQLTYAPYSAGSSRSLLTQVTVSATDGTNWVSLPPTTFTWQSDGAAGAFVTFGGDSSMGWQSDARVFPGDVNGDGRTDYMYVYRMGPNGNYGYDHAYLHTAIAQANGTFAMHGQETSLGWSSEYQWFAGDVNGDGKSDFMCAARIGPNGSYGYDHVFLQGGISLGNGSFTEYRQESSMGWSDPRFFPGDVNGDGKTDYMYVVHIGPNGNYGYDHAYFHTELSNCSGTDCNNSFAMHGQETSLGWSSEYQWFAGDVNGDGKSDFMCAARVGPNGSYGYDHVFLQGGISLGNGSFTEYRQESSMGWSDPRFFPGDVNGDGKTDYMDAAHHGPDGNYGYDHIYLQGATSQSPLDLVTTVNNSLGGRTDIAYTSSSAYQNTLLSFVLQTVSSIKTFKNSSDWPSNPAITTNYSYWDGLFNFAERDFRGFRYVTATAMNGSQVEATTETCFHQGDQPSWFVDTETCFHESEPADPAAALKGQIERQVMTSKEGHTKQIDNTWDVLQVGSTSASFPYLTDTVVTNTDAGYNAYQLHAGYEYDLTTFNVTREYKHGQSSAEDIDTHFSYNSLSKPTEVKVQDSSGTIVSRRWMDYDTNGNLTTEEVCKSDTPATGCAGRNTTQNVVTAYTLCTDGTGNVCTITDPRTYATTIGYDTTKTFPTSTTNYLNQTTTKAFNLGTGNLLQVISPHLQGTGYLVTYDYDPLGRKMHEYRPDGGVTTYGYYNIGTPATQYVSTQEHITGGSSDIDHYTYAFFDGLGRVYEVQGTTSNQQVGIVATTEYDNLGRVSSKSAPYYTGQTPYDTLYTYDGFGRVTDVQIPYNNQGTLAYYHIGTSYQGIGKAVTDRNNHTTTSTNDVHGRLKSVQDASQNLTQYNYDTRGNLIQVIADQGTGHKNVTTTMTYNSLGQKRSMTDPDMGYWTYDYDKAGNLHTQTDAKSDTITFTYDGLNRISTKVYPDRTVTYTYDTPDSGYVGDTRLAIGSLTKVSDPSGGELKEDTVLGHDVMQRVTKSRKTIGTGNVVTMAKAYDSAGRTVTLTYFPDDPNNLKSFGYTYDVGGNLVSVRYNTAGRDLVQYSNFTAAGQMGQAVFPKSGVTVQTNYTYDPVTTRLQSIFTQKTSQTPVTYQNMSYQFDGKGNLTALNDTQNAINHAYTYDELDRLRFAVGTGNLGYSQEYRYDAIGNITYKSDVGAYHYDSERPHAVTSTTGGPKNFTLQYDDSNGNMTQRLIQGDTTLNFTYNYDNKPATITGSATVTFTYDGNGERVRKVSNGQTTLYFGEVYESRGGVGIIHVFAGSQRIVSITTSNNVEQYYHPNHLGSASVMTDNNGNLSETIEYYPFGTYRTNLNPAAHYTFTGQEDDHELGLYNYKARLYDPLLGRFITPDSIVPQPGNPQSLNRYSYCLNNPLIYVDPSGHFSFGKLFKSFLTGLVAAAVFVVVGAAIVASGGAAAPGFLAAIGSIGSWSAGTMAIAGAAAGAVGGGMGAALNGGNILQGAVMGAAIGAATGGFVGSFAPGMDRAIAGIGLAVAGGGVAYAQGGLEGLANYGAGVAGAMVGAYGISYAAKNWNTWFPNSQPLQGPGEKMIGNTIDLNVDQAQAQKYLAEALAKAAIGKTLTEATGNACAYGGFCGKGVVPTAAQANDECLYVWSQIDRVQPGLYRAQAYVLGYTDAPVRECGALCYQITRSRDYSETCLGGR